MWQFIKLAGVAVMSIRGWIWIIGTVAPAVVTYMSGVIDQVPLYQLIPLVTGVLALGACLVYYSMRGFDYAVRYIGTRVELERVANELQDLVDVGHDYLPISEIAAIWADDQAMNVWNFNPKLRRLKVAIDQKKIRTQLADNDSSEMPIANVSDTITLFRSGEIARLTYGDR